MISTIVRSERSTFAVSLGVFAAAGAANTSVSASSRTLLATTLAVLGVYGLARYARTVRRRRLAVVSLSLWIAFLAVAPVHAIGLETVGAIVPVATETVVVGLTALTWTTLLGAFASTAFLGLREYGTGAEAGTPDERTIESDYDL